HLQARGASHLDNFALECPRTEQQHYPERTGICPRLELYCRSLGQRRRPEILPRWLMADAGLRWCGATPLSTERRISNAAITSRTNDCGNDEGHRLATALGARLPGRRGAQAPQIEAQLQEGGRQPSLPDRGRRRWRIRTPVPTANLRQLTDAGESVDSSID